MDHDFRVWGAFKKNMSREDKGETIPVKMPKGNAMTWQRCPICEGSGKQCKAQQNGQTVSIDFNETCDTCAGKKIIHCETGRPPGESAQTIPLHEEAERVHEHVKEGDGR